MGGACNAFFAVKSRERAENLGKPEFSAELGGITLRWVGSGAETWKIAGVAVALRAGVHGRNLCFCTELRLDAAGRCATHFAAKSREKFENFSKTRFFGGNQAELGGIAPRRTGGGAEKWEIAGVAVALRASARGRTLI